MLARLLEKLECICTGTKGIGMSSSARSKQRVDSKKPLKPEPPPASPPEKVDEVDESSQESFPASDAPAWTSGHDDPTPEEKKKPN